MVTDPMVLITDNKFDSLSISWEKVNDEMSFSKSSDFRDKPVSSVFMLEVNTANSKIVAETQEEMKAVEQYMSDIQDISHKFDFVTKHGSEKQIFRLIKTLETGLSRKSEDLEKLISSLNVQPISFSCLQSSDNTITPVLLQLHNNK
jgi:hypothetical protein